MKKREIPERYWAVIAEDTGLPILVAGQMPVFWRRKPAQLYAAEHGLEIYGKKRDVRIVRVTLAELG